MGNLLDYLSPQPLLTADDFRNDPSQCFTVPDDILQLEADICNVYEGRVAIETFPPEYQQRIIGYYRIKGVRQNSKSHNIARMTPDTMDLI